MLETLKESEPAGVLFLVFHVETNGSFKFLSPQETSRIKVNKRSLESRVRDQSKLVFLLVLMGTHLCSDGPASTQYCRVGGRLGLSGNSEIFIYLKPAVFSTSRKVSYSALRWLSHINPDWLVGSIFKNRADKHQVRYCSSERARCLFSGPCPQACL